MTHFCTPELSFSHDMQQIRFPQLKGGVYRVSSAARRDPQLYIERQVDESILAVQNNPPFNAQLVSLDSKFLWILFYVCL
jgi:hypothetical protein